jgi:hypothetical protein
VIFLFDKGNILLRRITELLFERFAKGIRRGKFQLMRNTSDLFAVSELFQSKTASAKRLFSGTSIFVKALTSGTVVTWE